jgi:trk system potassium uptake protein TrkA
MAQKRNEFAVIGLGRFGSALALSLEEHEHYVLGIDDNMDIVQSLSSQLTHVVALDATDENALMRVDITSFENVIVAIGADFESNLLITVALKQLGVKHVICKTITHRQRSILLRVGADRVVMPEHDAGGRLAEELMNPGLLERFSLGPGYSIAEITAPAAFIDKSLAQSDLRRRFGINVLVVKRGTTITTSPPADFILLRGDIVVVLAAIEQIEAFTHS